MDKQFLTPEELYSLQTLNNERNELTNSFGNIEVEIQNLELQKKELINQLVNLNNKSVSLGNKFREKYGEGNIDIVTGEFIKR